MGCIKSKEKEEPPTQIQDAEPKTVDPRLPWDTYRQYFNMRNSWKAITRALEATAKENFSRLFKKYPQYKAYHKKLSSYDDDEEMFASEAFAEAATEYFNVLDEFMECIEKLDFAIMQLKAAGKSYVTTEGFQVEYFQDMESSFIEAVGITMGDRFTEATENNFRLFYGFVSKTMEEGFYEGGGKSVPKDSALDTAAVDIAVPET